MTAQILEPLRMPLSGTHLIEASAGTGKTYTIATLYVRMVAELQLTVDRILVVTFTEAAAAELRDRIRTRLRAAAAAIGGPASEGARGSDPLLHEWAARRAEHREGDRRRLDFAIRTFDEASISTIHGFCQRVLHDSAFETGVAFETELVANQQPMLDLAVRDFWARELYDADPRFVSYLSRKLTPPRLLKLANRAASHPGVPLLPSDNEVRKQPDVAPFVAAFRRARELWHADREEIEGALLDHAGFKARWYPTTELPAWFLAMDTFLRDEDPGASLGFGQLEKFTPRSLENGTLKDYRLRGAVPTHPFFDACGELLNARAPLMNNFEVRMVELKRRLCRYVWRELPRRKKAAGVQSFDDLLFDLDRALGRRHGGKELAEAIRGRYTAALIDEFQDTDPVQYRIFKAIYGGTERPLFLIGDPKQAIYGFRGADVFAYLDAARTVKRRARHTMDTNWRSDPQLLQGIEHLFDVRRPFFLEGIGFIPVGARPDAQARLRCGDTPMPAFEIQFVPRAATGARGKDPQIPINWSNQHVPALVAADISKLLHAGASIDGRPVHAGDIAVLSRTNAQALAVQAALRELGIPGVVYGDASVFDSREAAELQRVLSAAAEPTTAGLLRAAVTTELLGVTGGELDAMRNDDDASWDRWVQLFRRWNALWTDRGFIQMLRAIMEDASLQRRLLRLPDGERRMTNLLHLAELLHTAASTGHLGPAGLLHWLAEQRTVDQTMSEAVKLRLERDDEAVQLITVHRAKGLEYPVVYCPYLWHADELRIDEEEHLLFHDVGDGNRLKLDIGIKPTRKDERRKLPNVARAQFETTAESLRLLYVALTRARHRVVLLWGQFDRCHRSALGYLLHAPRSGTWAWDPELVASNIRKLTDTQMLQALRERADPTWTLVERVDPAPGLPWSPPRSDAQQLRPRTPRVSLDRFFRTSSFTQMAGAHTVAATQSADGRDHDERLGGGMANAPARSAGQRISLADFPRGATVGNFFHDVLEHVDFGADYDGLFAVVEDKLARFGFAPREWAHPITRAVQGILECPLGERVRLCDVGSRDRLRELGFVMPIAGGREDRRDAIDRHALVRAFTEDSKGLPAGYAARLTQLGFVPLRGFLKGFIDLVFRVGKKWYVVDYKTNFLGETTEDYAKAPMTEVMRDEHYVLQYHLYTLALIRHLQVRQPGFDYNRHFGGVMYLFLRGMPEGVGVYRDRPPRARMQALSALFESPPTLGGAP